VYGNSDPVVTVLLVRGNWTIHRPDIVYDCDLCYNLDEPMRAKAIYHVRVAYGLGHDHLHRLVDDTLEWVIPREFLRTCPESKFPLTCI
jgi:hypothetical protein